MDYYWSGGSFFGMHFFWWFFWVALIVIAFSVATPVPRSRMRLYDDPLAILRRRYAAGEITTDEYDERKARIERDMRDHELPAPRDTRSDRPGLGRPAPA